MKIKVFNYGKLKETPTTYAVPFQHVQYPDAVEFVIGEIDNGYWLTKETAAELIEALQKFIDTNQAGD